MIDLASYYKGKRVLITGHTGFKGTWLVEALTKLGADVSGYSLPRDDVRDAAAIAMRVRVFGPEFVFHLAAQAYVPVGFDSPRQTFDTNVGGTTNVLDALRLSGRPCAVVIVTSDKCYLPTGLHHDERSPLGGHDPYSASKAAAEHVVEAYRTGFFAPDHRIAVATARAGNVIGGGDYGPGRLIPNAVAALREGRPIPVYNPEAIRPWQYVEDVINGYLRLGAMLSGTNRALFCEAWNFGPAHHFTVREVCEAVIDVWGSGSWEIVRASLRETSALRIDSSKARARLGWRQMWPFSFAINETIKWYRDRQ